MKYTKWIPLHAFTRNCDSYLIQARKNIRTGLIKFKTTRISEYSHYTNLGLDATIQFEKLDNLIEKE